MQDMSDPTVPNLPNTTVAEWEQIADTLQNHVDSLPGIVADRKSTRLNSSHL